ncbi:MAG: T9SS type A sorting domain-containing protein, partial [Bacteroidota bacterium]
DTIYTNVTVNAIPPVIIVQPNSYTSKCTGGSISLGVQSSGTPLFYQWYKNGLPLPGQTNSILTFTSLTLGDAGSYTVLVYNTADSILSASSELSISAPSTNTQTASICNGGAYTLPSGVVVNASGTYTSVLTNQGGCDSIITTILTLGTATTTVQYDTICAGQSYSFAGNTYSTSGTYTQNLTAVTGCDSIIQLQLYVLSAPSYDEYISVCYGSTYTLPSGTVVSATGTYQSVFTATSGCDSKITTHFTVNSQLIPDAQSGKILCFGATTTINVTATGGTPPYSGTGIRTVAAGTYTYIVTDALGCSATVGPIVVTEPSQLVVSATSTAAQAYDGYSGTATAQPAGGTAGYSFRWNTVPVQTTATATMLRSGAYTVVVTDANGCTASASVIITQPAGDCSAFRTYGPGGWGSTANGFNPAVYLNANFPTAYPNGLQIGSCNRFIRLSNSSVVRLFLPTSGTPRQLSPGTLVDPTAVTYSNTFAGQLVALNLNITFDSLNAGFAGATVMLKNALIASGPFAGWTVQRVYDEANRVIGCGGNKNYISSLTTVLDQINNSWINGVPQAGNIIRCPLGIARITDEYLGSTSTIPMTLFPNPVYETVFVRYVMDNPGEVELNVYDISGRCVFSRQLVHEASGESTQEIDIRQFIHSSGLYLLRLSHDGRVEENRLVVAE